MTTTTVYFIRHARSDYNIKDDMTRPLSADGKKDTALVTDFLISRNLDAVLSSPYHRAVETVEPFAQKVGLSIETIDDFRERKVDSQWVEDFTAFSKKQWANFDYKLSDGESLLEVQSRNITALLDVLSRFEGKTIAIGTHGTALSTIINYFDKSYGYEDFEAMVGLMPWVVKMTFNGNNCAGIQMIDLFKPGFLPDYNNCVATTYPLGELGAYIFTVIFARYKDKWLYCRHRDRDCFETPGGHIEQGETAICCAKRELYEETGASKFNIRPLFDYRVRVTGNWSNGQVFLADIEELGPLPIEFEMTEIKLFDTIPDKMRFEKILPVLFERVVSDIK